MTSYYLLSGVPAVSPKGSPNSVETAMGGGGGGKVVFYKNYTLKHACY